MPILVMRFDLRNPAFAGVSATERYRAALDMSAWADDHGVMAIVLSEHHGSDDGYLPSALTMAAAVAARTERVQIWVSAVAAPLHDPLHLAEEATVVDLISGGRFTVVLANGYVPDEFALFDVPLGERAARTTEAVEVLRASRTGEPFPFRGRTVRLTPAPEGPPGRAGPTVLLGGSGPAAARRAARIADGFQPSTPEAWEVYRAERLARGKADPGDYLAQPTGFLHVADDPDAAWEVIRPHARHEAESYGRWAAAAGMDGATGYQPLADDDVDGLRESGRYRVLTPDALRAEVDADPGAILVLNPMMGGLPPDVGWDGLHGLAAALDLDAD
ncbi:LLM class flavin-dependent oxidoreductase [Iamia sp. SCSIO 61187]|uniref:LLM class flavin-dependent oxidoreductase n=1 Tax=Iamia sp. SCSIO 61187 TaxID=2722752 RepID=UPI001C62DCE7|nr:LLM class flavin-dependent oxidoreductase [Iamia sp. SCSIO 61187]QYG94018.1 LLM class flavin-dependent oxidoreductase [Iamia sp. SCSIO 61187]